MCVVMYGADLYVCSLFLCLSVLYLSKALPIPLSFFSKVFFTVFPVLPYPKFVAFSVKPHYSYNSTPLVPWNTFFTLVSFQPLVTCIRKLKPTLGAHTPPHHHRLPLESGMTTLIGFSSGSLLSIDLCPCICPTEKH